MLGENGGLGEKVSQNDMIMMNMSDLVKNVLIGYIPVTHFGS